MLTHDLALAGRYRIDREVGRGGMARVYRGVDTVLNRTVAVKVLNPEYASDPTFVERFRREARAAARLNHPNVVAVFDTGSDADIHFIVMEFVEGRTLAEVLADDAHLEPDRAARIAERVAEALSFAHANGLVHRDVKPANVMITPTGQVKVMDFGIARLATSHTITQTSTVFGTAAYLAPEQAQGKRVDGRADVYALGVVLYEMLAGRVPFQADSAIAMASKHVLEDPEPPSEVRPGVPPALEAVAMRALEKDPAARYPDAAAMAAALRAAAPVGTDTVPLVAPAATAVMGDRTDLLPPTRGGVHAAARGGRPRWIVPAAALALVALIAIVLLAASLGHGKPRSLLPFRPARQSHNATHPPSAAATTPPATTAPPSTAPPTTGPPASAPTSVGDAAAVVTSVVDQALSAGLIDDHTAQDVEHGVQDAQHHYSDEGDTARAVESISQAKDRLAEAASKGDASAQAAAAISRALDSLANAMLASPPPSGDQGGGPQGKHDHGGGQGNGEGD